MPQKQSLLRILTPELNRITQRSHRLPMPANKTAPKIDLVAIVFFGVQESELTDVVGDGVEEGARYIFGGEGGM